MKFQITSNNQTWNKEIKISILPPEKFELNQNYPNPFNPLTNISFSIPKMTNVKVEVFNFLGERVSELINKNLDAGVYSYNFDGKDLPSGIYFYRIITPEFSETKKMLLIK